MSAMIDHIAHIWLDEELGGWGKYIVASVEYDDGVYLSAAWDEEPAPGRWRVFYQSFDGIPAFSHGVDSFGVTPQVLSDPDTALLLDYLRETWDGETQDQTDRIPGALQTVKRMALEREGQLSLF